MPTPAKERDARRWKKELQLAGKREKEWRDQAEKVIKRYRGEERKKNRFNVLWSNTETLRPAIYNSRPNPDVRRRFRDADPVGKAVSEVLERSLMVMVDYECTDQTFKNDVLDSLLSGRGLSRIRYIPSLKQVGERPKRPDDGSEQSGTGASPDDPDNESTVGDSSGEEQEEVENEQVLPEHVDWRDFRHGYGRVWDEVGWVAFRHQMTRPDAEKMLGKPALKGVIFAQPEPDDPNKTSQEEQQTDTQKVAEFWEFWDKVGERVFFLHDKLDTVLFPLDNADGKAPIDFTGFFPVPQPLMLIENTGSLLPIIPFSLYEQQANELDKISARIDHITDKARLRGIFDSKLEEMQSLLDSNDNELVPVQNAQAWLDGGLDKAISWFPVEKAAAMLTALYEARREQKAIIDEITGIADIVRGATDPNETAQAQDLKATFGSIRLQRMQKEVQRYCKDVIRLASEAMCGRFAPETFAEMTELNFPTAVQKQQMIMQAQQQAQQQAMMPQQSGPNSDGIATAQGAGSPPSPLAPPPVDPGMLQMPTWEDVLQLMRSSAMRRFKVDVETDSTVAGTLNSDMTGLSQVMKAITETMQGLAPLVSAGALPIDAAKELIQTVIRRARMGMAVEDAFEKLQAPKPPPDPEMIKAQAQQQQAQVEAQTKLQLAQGQAQIDLQIAQQKAQIEAAAEAKVAQVKAAADSAQQEREQQFEAQRQALEEQHKTARETDLAKLEAATKIIVAMIAAKAQADAAEAAASAEFTSQEAH